MAIEFVIGSNEYYLNIRPAFITIKTNDSLLTVMTEGYLDNENTLNYSDDLIALVQTSEGLIYLSVSTANNHVSLIAPLAP